MTCKLDWNIAVYCANEAERLAGCLACINRALTGRHGRITVILNGSRDRSPEIASAAAREGAPIEVFRIGLADKANAMNQFYHVLRSPAHAYAGIDAYVFIARDALRAMEERFQSDPRALAITGVAANGRSMRHATAATLRTGGRLHGQFHALRPGFLDRMVARGIRLPVGLYRGDGLLGSMLAHDLDPLATPWDNTRIAGVAGATYEIPVLSPFRVQDIRRYLRRRVRQMRGRIENAAIRSVIYRAGYEALPEHADDLIRTFLMDNSAPSVAITQLPFRHLAIRAALRSTAPAPELLVAQALQAKPAACARRSVQA